LNYDLKYSHIATLDEIKENDYNLNIPRYVDTFEEEEEIDIKEVQKQLKEIDKEIAETDKELNKYLKDDMHPIFIDMANSIKNTKKNESV
jgi:type I restriction-modification system DNA methylase subunit